MHKDLKDIIDENKIAKLAISPNAQEAFFGKNGLIKELVKNTLQTAFNAERAYHLEQTNAAEGGMARLTKPCKAKAGALN